MLLPFCSLNRLLVTLDALDPLMRPIERLSTIAERITRGDLENVDLSDGMRFRDEIGALAASLERMRSSLKAALSRLAREVS